MQLWEGESFFFFFLLFFNEYMGVVSTVCFLFAVVLLVDIHVDN